MWSTHSKGLTVSKGWVILFAILGLGACSSDRALQPEASADPVCAAQAAARARDADLNGFDHPLQRKIYDRAYKDCVFWASKSITVGFR